MISINKRLLLCLLCVALLHVGGLALSLPISRVIPDNHSVGVVLVYRAMEDLPVAVLRNGDIDPATVPSESDVADVELMATNHLISQRIVPLPQEKTMVEPVSVQVDKKKAVVRKPRPEPPAITDPLTIGRGISSDEVLTSVSTTAETEPVIPSKDSVLPAAASRINAVEKNQLSSHIGRISVSTTEQKAQPRYGYQPPPSYPRLARQRGWQGIVEYEVKVLSSGAVGELVLKTSSGYKNLDDAARRAIAKWRFNPATRSGVPVESWVVVPVSFILGANH